MAIAIVAKLWCPGLVVSSLLWNDAIASDCDLSPKDDKDTGRIDCNTEEHWFYETTMMLLLELFANPIVSAICGFSDGGLILNWV